jgi:hypothetical protein
MATDHPDEAEADAYRRGFADALALVERALALPSARHLEATAIALAASHPHNLPEVDRILRITAKSLNLPTPDPAPWH